MSGRTVHCLIQHPLNLSHRFGVDARLLPSFSTFLGLHPPTQDWQHTLLQRAAELAPGGRLIIVNFCISPEGHWLGHSDVGPCMYDTMRMLWKQMQSEGRITQVCGTRMSIA